MFLVRFVNYDGKIISRLGEISRSRELVGTYRAICCSKSCIFARLEVFLGLGFGNDG